MSKIRGIGMNIYDKIEKPEDWPVNETEVQLDNISNQMEKFIENPTNRNREVLISLVSKYDLNQSNMRGLFRTTKYEIALINTLFIQGMMTNCRSLITYLYDLVGRKTRLQKMTAYMAEVTDISIEVKYFDGLIGGLNFYYITYQNFTVDKDKSYAEKIVEFIETVLDETKIGHLDENAEEIIDSLTHAYIEFLNDISYIRSIKCNRIWAFDREEIYKLYSLAAKLLKMTNYSVMKRPIRGVMMTSISNYILKSRYDYNEDYVCKYVSPEVAYKSVLNQQIWMSIIENLNDDRELKVVPELFENTNWINYKWVENIDFTPIRKYYVSSFSKSINSKKMRDMYGSCTYGYKDDRVAELIAPIMMKKLSNGNEIPIFAQVISFDVLYDKEIAKEELNYLCSIIDLFDLSGNEKEEFLQDILQYWILSVKDESWEYEREHRYVIFMYDEYQYKCCDITDKNFLKTETTIFLLPDFILGKNPMKDYLKKMVNNKLEVLSVQPYLFCEDCFGRDYDAVIGVNKVSVCPVCGSKKVKTIIP